MAEADVFYCEVRERVGKGGARAARRDGFVPGVLYGGGKAPVAIRLREMEVATAHAAGRMRAHLAKIDVPGQEELQPVITREVQVDPVKDRPIHVDLMRVDESTRIDVEVPVRFINSEESPGLKRGGVLNIVRHEIEIYAPATAIPAFLVADVAGLDIGDSLHVSTIKLPEGVTLVISDRDFTVATIAAPSALKAEEELEEKPVGEEEDVEAGEVPATEQKSDDEEAEENR